MYDQSQCDFLEDLTIGRHRGDEPQYGAAGVAPARERLADLLARVNEVIERVRRADHEQFLKDIRQRSGE